MRRPVRKLRDTRLEQDRARVAEANLVDAVRMLHIYYDDPIEKHNTRPRDIERALEDDFDDDGARRNL